MFSTQNNRRLINEQKKMEANKNPLFTAAPLKDNLFEWHFTLRGQKDTCFEGGIYHGKIILPDEYPFKAPDMVFLTKNGRFDIGKNIGLSITSYHNESWTPAWNIITILEAVNAFFLVDEAGVGSLKQSSAERKKLAEESRKFVGKDGGACALDVEKKLISLENEMFGPKKGGSGKSVDKADFQAPSGNPSK